MIETTAPAPRWPTPTVPSLDELRALSEAASFGPWAGCAHVEGTDPDCPCRYRGDIWAVIEDVVVCQMGFGPDQVGRDDEPDDWRSVPTTSLDQGYANGRFIAAAVNYVRFVLLSEPLR